MNPPSQPQTSEFPPLPHDGRSAAVCRAENPPALNAPTGAGVWAESDLFSIDQYHPDGSDHHPLAVARALYDDEALYLQFSVEDRYVRAVQTEFQAPVCTDSCVEFFFWPSPSAGYFNVEINCGATMLWQYYPNVAPPPPGEWRQKVQPTAQEAAAIERWAQLSLPIETEIAEPLDWRLAMRLPFASLEPYVGAEVAHPKPGTVWRANFYKCGDHTSHPHWGAWSSIGPELSFHQPARFGRLVFA